MDKEELYQGVTEVVVNGDSERMHHGIPAGTLCRVVSYENPCFLVTLHPKKSDLGQKTLGYYVHEDDCSVWLN